MDIINGMARMRDAERAQDEQDRKRTDGIRATAQRIAERDLHVSATVREAARHVIGRLKRGMRTYRTMTKEERRALWIGARDGVKSNRDIYRIAMGGTR